MKSRLFPVVWQIFHSLRKRRLHDMGGVGQIVVLTVAFCIGCSGGDETVSSGRPKDSGGPMDTLENEPVSDPWTDAQIAFARGEFGVAKSSLRKCLLVDPGDVRALELAGDIDARLDQPLAATVNYRAAVEHSESPSEALWDKYAMQLSYAGRSFETLEVLQQWILQYPNSAQPRTDYVGLSAILGLADQMVPSLRWLAQRGGADPETLQVLAYPRRVEPDPEFCRDLLKQHPEDRRPEFSLARLDAQELRWPEAQTRLKEVLSEHPDFVPAFTLYGRCLAESGKFAELEQWREKVPVGVEANPEYWLVIGLWAQHQGEHAKAARAFWEGIKADQTGDPESLSELLVSLKQIGRNDAADQVANHLAMQSRLRDALSTHLERKARSQQAAMRLAETMMQMGRHWEAAGWARVAMTLPDDRFDEAMQQFTQLRSGLTAKTPWQSPNQILSRQLDLADLPMVDGTESGSSQIVSRNVIHGEILFQDQAQSRGLQHTCEVAPETKTEGHWIYQSVGGGVGVIDFDLDGWPDIAAAMLDGKPLQMNSSPNRLFRNIDGQFRDDTVPAGYTDRGFAQGITVGDFNEDGFPDLFDANIGANRLFRNNGDGTFTEVASAVGLDGDQWTTSAVITDIDGDHISDLFEVSYCAGQEPYEKECRSKKGLGSCPPLNFEAQPDRVWRGRGDGTFVESTNQWMRQSTPGRGLGLIAGAFDEFPGVDIYIANDMTANHLWSGKMDEGQFRLRELGAIRGLANSGRSRSQASMGMTAADADGDGDMDFFLTHFSDDHNTYYEQVSAGLWVDRTYQVGLSTPSIKLLGFGTEWVDFDNNGNPELIIANGHVDEVKREDLSYRMPPQLFRRNGDGGWDEVNRSGLGDYFGKDHLGRALATIDFDRNGLSDVVITHLYEPVSLLANQTKQIGGSVHLVLKSTQSSRDAIGAVVKATVGGQPIAGQLTAGDGYMCSNQRCVRFGTGEFNTVKDLTVEWPSGRTDDFGDIKAGHEYLLVEGHDEVHEMSRTR